VYATDPELAKAIIAERKQLGSDRYDEVWQGVYVVMPQPNMQHQQFVARFCHILEMVLEEGKLGTVFAGANVSDREAGWLHNYREPDVVVVSQDSHAKILDAHVQGGPDFIVEILSAGDPAREKIPFYGQIGVGELLIVDRDPWALELLRLQGDKLEPVGRSTLDDSAWLVSEVIPLRLRLQPGDERPMIEAGPPDGSWTRMI
jgi:Uma2 family endonuclease